MPPQAPLDWHPVPAPARIPLAGRTVILEPLDAALHAASIFSAAQGHDNLWDYLGDGPYAQLDVFTAALTRKQHGTDAVFFALVPHATGQAAGYASLMRIDAPNGVVEVGNILMTPAIQRTTAATEAMYLMARHIFEDLGYRRYEWKCNAENEPSRRAALRYGFQFEGLFRQHMVIKGRNRDTAWFSMLDSEWPARKRAFEAWLNPANFDASGRQLQPLSAF
ncbi:MAG TPA: GNAT family protein [Terracidiphilus sp.]